MDRIPTRPFGLGIDYGGQPEAQFTSAGARAYARERKFQQAYAYEEICKMLRQGMPPSEEDQSRWVRDLQIIQSIFGDAAPEVMEHIQIECDSTYDPGEPNSGPVYEAINDRRSVRAWGQGGRPMTSSWARRARPVTVLPAPPRTLPARSIPAQLGPVRTSWARGFFSPMSPWQSPLINPWT